MQVRITSSRTRNKGVTGAQGFLEFSCGYLKFLQGAKKCTGFYTQNLLKMPLGPLEKHFTSSPEFTLLTNRMNFQVVVKLSIHWYSFFKAENTHKYYQRFYLTICQIDRLRIQLDGSVYKVESKKSAYQFYLSK